MAVASCHGGGALREQLRGIMAALAQAAVAEICAAVDEGYAALRAEVRRGREENEALRKKLHLIESIVVRGGSSGGDNNNNQQQQQQPEVGPAAVGAPRAETTPQQRPQQADSDRGPPAADPGGTGGTGGTGGATVTVVVREELPDVVLIKDEDSDTNDSCEEDTRTAADGGTAAARDAATSTPVGRSRKRHWPRGEAADRKPSSEQLAPKASRAASGPPPKATVSVYALDSPRGEPGRSSQLGGGEEMELAGDAVCAYASQMDPDVQLVHQECSLVPPGAGRQAAYFGSGALLGPQSPAGRGELDLSLTWTKQAKGPMAFTQFHQSESQDDDAFGIKLISVSGSASTDSQLSEGSNSALEYDNGDLMNYALYREQPHHAQQDFAGGGIGAAARGKRFVCPVCSRTYATAQNLDVHMRIHTGERPFSCDQCGKKFTQSAHLKSHLSVHSGERPYACTLCSRSFIVKYSLKLHVKKCHPGVVTE